MQKNILITGAAGFLGKSLSINLLEFNPIRLILVDRNISELEKLKTDLEKIHTSTIINYVVCDIKSTFCLEKIFDKYRPKYIYHLAAYTNIKSYIKFPEEVINNNFNINITISDLCIKYKIEKFIYISNKFKKSYIHFYDIINRISELYLLSKFESCKEKIKFIAIRFGKILEYDDVAEVNEKRVEFSKFNTDYPEIIFENVNKNEIVNQVIDAAIHIEESNILHYESSSEHIFFDTLKQNNTGLEDSEINKNNMFFKIVPEHEVLVKTSHNKISIIRSEIHKKINLNKIIMNILSIKTNLNFSISTYLNELRVVLKEEFVEKQKLKI